MAEQFRNLDAPNRAQQVQITWSMETPDDDSCSDAPDERQDGFWPSRNKSDAGYCPPELFDKSQADAQRLMKEWRAGDWNYVGVVAVASVAIPIGQGSFVTHKFRSAGVWGIESYSPEYHKEVFAEEKAELLSQLKKLGLALEAGDFTERG